MVNFENVMKTSYNDKEIAFKEEKYDCNNI
ncbi:Uncharacterised protein [Staphylococcus saprophyticus]|nr:Uncharacterised protein [Staphylococcus saprophyticus]